MPLPMSDVMQAYRNNPEKTEEAVHKVGFLSRTGPDAAHWPCDSKPFLLTGFLHIADTILPNEEPDAASPAQANLSAAAGDCDQLIRTGQGGLNTKVLICTCLGTSQGWEVWGNGGWALECTGVGVTWM